VFVGSGVLVTVLVTVGVGVLVLVTVGVIVDVGVTDGVRVALGVILGVTELVGVFVGVGVFVTVDVGVGVGVLVLVGVGVGVAGAITNVKSLVVQAETLQSGQSGLNIWNWVILNSKLCLTSGADKGSTYILNCETAPSKVPAKFCSKSMLVVNPLNDVPEKSIVGKHSGSC
jgi:hypothetical protein